MLQHVANVVQCDASCFSVLQCGAVSCSVVRLDTGRPPRPITCDVRCSVLQRVAACCSVLQRVAAWCMVHGAVWCSAVQRVTACCSVLHPDAGRPPYPIASNVCCSVLQHAAVYCRVLQCAAVCCSVKLQCVAACCSVVQRVKVWYEPIAVGLYISYRGL